MIQLDVLTAGTTPAVEICYSDTEVILKHQINCTSRGNYFSRDVILSQSLISKPKYYVKEHGDVLEIAFFFSVEVRLVNTSLP